MIPMIVPLAGKGTRMQVYVSRTMNAAGLAMVKIVDPITSIDGEAVFIPKSYVDPVICEEFVVMSNGPCVGNEMCPSVTSRPVVYFSVVPTSSPEGILGEPRSIRLQ